MIQMVTPYNIKLVFCRKLLLFLGKSTKSAATRAALFDPNMHQIVCRLGLRPGPTGGDYSAPPDTQVCVGGLLLKTGRGGGKGEGEGRGRRGRERKGGKKGKRRRGEGREGGREFFALGRKQKSRRLCGGLQSGFALHLVQC